MRAIMSHKNKTNEIRGKDNNNNNNNNVHEGLGAFPLP
jgi:hypothetical protein